MGFVRLIAICQLLFASVFKDHPPGTLQPEVNSELYHLFAFVSREKRVEALGFCARGQRSAATKPAQIREWRMLEV